MSVHLSTASPADHNSSPELGKKILIPLSTSALLMIFGILALVGGLHPGTLSLGIESVGLGAALITMGGTLAIFTVCVYSAKFFGYL